MTDNIYLCGLIGMDIQSSRSPAMHMTEADALGLRLIYRLFDLAQEPLKQDDLSAILNAVEKCGFAGVNVTHPFKQKIIPLLNSLSDEARAIGAVNTVIFENGHRTGHNTDWSGFAESLSRQLPDADLSRIVQFGAGGAGAATAMAMLRLGCEELVIVDTNEDHAQLLADRLNHIDGCKTNVRLAKISPELELGSATGLINATPLGMEGYDGMPVQAEWLHPSLWVADVVYFPLETELLKTARDIGCKTAHGGEMAVFQAARAFDLFTGHVADRDRMLKNF
ncbi:MAG: shikimate dehydrogenase [Sphingobium sp.]|nr:shikimate dehydrogenase [Sphingobium sp.]